VITESEQCNCRGAVNAENDTEASHGSKEKLCHIIIGEKALREKLITSPLDNPIFVQERCNAQRRRGAL
jgi:hypothetical protein